MIVWEVPAGSRKHELEGRIEALFLRVNRVVKMDNNFKPAHFNFGSYCGFVFGICARTELRQETKRA